MREWLAFNTFQHWPISLSNDFAIRLIKYGTSCCGHVTVTLFDIMSYIGYWHAFKFSHYICAGMWIEISVLWARLLHQMTKGNTGLSPYFWTTTWSVIGNNIWYDIKNDMIAIFLFPCCFNYHLKLHTFSHGIKSNRNKLKSVEHHLSPSISTLISLNGL